MGLRASVIIFDCSKSLCLQNEFSLSWNKTGISNLDVIGHFRILQKEKNRVEAERTSLQFPLYKQRKIQICTLILDFVLLFLHNSKVAYYKKKIENLLSSVYRPYDCITAPFYIAGETKKAAKCTEMKHARAK